MISKPYEAIAVGDTATTDWHIVTEEYVRDFAELTGDKHPLHLDADYAATNRFGQRIAHGALMLSTLLGLVELDPRYFQAFYGLDNVRFLAPTFFGDRVQSHSEVLGLRDRSDGATAVVTCRAWLVNQDGTKVFQGDFQFLVGRHLGRDNEQVVAG
ncbi:acyl dehydratase [Gordonia sp. TBRC 11910]|uniref:Acyl dehydratase n=1 Tax=Gordonia asplenii TaxID=2725283 RepID=A0A848L2M5_9ACTN|nr:MaoC/PaaZ C-terminal domain-containing protein [Gordonia asplenii]NMO04682.1 acyl dehydratase [Gordonia asplenii]